MTDFKVGDRVRATLGENVIVGTYGSEYGHEDNEKPFVDITVSDGPCDCQTVTLDTALWQIEKVPPPLPTKVGAIIKRVDGHLFARSDDIGNPWVSLFVGTHNVERIAAHGGFEVIFEGVES